MYETCATSAEVDTYVDDLVENVMGYPECMSGYNCDLEDTSGECKTNVATVAVVIKVFCESSIGEVLKTL